MKRCLIGVVLLMSALLAFAGGGGQKAAEKKTVRIMVWGSSEIYQQGTDLILKKFPELAAKTNVEWFVAGPSPFDCSEKFRLALAANESVCDMHYFNYMHIGEFARAGALLDINDLVAPYANDLLPGFKNLTQYEGKTVSLSIGANPKVWFYRKDIFDKAGVIPEDVKNLDDFIAAGKKIQQINPKYKMWALGTTNEMNMYEMVLSGTSTGYADKDGKFTLTTDPNFRKLLEAYITLKKSGVVGDQSAWTPDWQRAFTDEVLVSYPLAPWLVASVFVPTYAPDQKGKWYATSHWPSFIGESGGGEDAAVFVIPKYSKEPELAKEFLKHALLTKEGYLLWRDVGLPIMPLMKSWVNDPQFNVPDDYVGGNLMAVKVKAMDNFKALNSDPAHSLEVAIINPVFDDIINGKMSVDDGLRKLQADLQNQIGNPWDL
jgi:ABC-type glycerol-3-phosphate transport system substrate-binding protein